MFVSSKTKALKPVLKQDSLGVRPLVQTGFEGSRENGFKQDRANAARR